MRTKPNNKPEPSERAIRAALTRSRGSLYYASRIVDCGAFGLHLIIKDSYPQLKPLVKRNVKVKHAAGTHPAFKRNLNSWGNDYFRTQVEGDCLTGIGINDGAFLDVERTDDVRDGDFVVCRIGGVVLVKRLHVTKSGRVVLRTANPKHPHIPVTRSMDFEIFGRVLAWTNWSTIRPRLKTDTSPLPPARIPSPAELAARAKVAEIRPMPRYDRAIPQAA